MSRYRAVIWDWNGTLLDDLALSVEIGNELLAERGLPALTNERYREIFEFPAQRYWERAGVDFARESFAALSRRFAARFEQRLHRAALFPEVPGVLAALRARGLRQLVLSGTEHGQLQRLLLRFGIASAFEHAQGLGDTLARGKLGAGRALLRATALDPSRTLLIGDTAHDAEVAAALGVDCLLVSAGHQAHERLCALPGARVARALSDAVAPL